MSALGVDLMNVIFGDLIKIFSVESRSRMRRNFDRALHLSARRIEGVQLVTGSEPDVLTIIGDAMDSLGTRKGPIFADDFGGGFVHAPILVVR